MIPKNSEFSSWGFIIIIKNVMKIRKWDLVKIMSWKQNDRWLDAEVLKVFKDKNKVLIKWVNFVTKHKKKEGTNPWKIVKIEKPIDVSNVMLVCPFTKKPTRIGFTMITEKGKNKKFRYSKKALKEQGWEPKNFIIK